MTQDLISMDKKYRTKAGWAVRILCTDLKDSRYPVAAAITIPAKRNDAGEIIVDSAEMIQRYTADGSYIHSDGNHSFDLVEISPAEDYKVDDPVWVRDHVKHLWIRRHFAKYEDGRFYVWSNGATSFSAEGPSDVSTYRYSTKENPND